MEATIRAAVTAILQDLGIDEVNFVVEHPSDPTHGDYATNVALVAAKQLGKPPREVAETLSTALADKIERVAKIEVAGPGFINFFLTRDFFTETVEQVETAGNNWGRHDTLTGKTYLVEYTDPNPFKEFHIGHLFTNTVGEAISRLVEYGGAETKRLCYQGDVGMHVAHAIYGLQQLGFTAQSEMTAADLGRAYALGATAYKEGTPEVVEATKALNKKIYDRSDETVNELYDKGRTVSLQYFEHIYQQLGTRFDEYFFESETGPEGKELVLQHPDVFPESEGAKVFAGEEYGLHTRVFLNSEGLPTYEAKELALAKMKEDRLGVYDHSIISTANEITEYFKVLKKAMSFIYPELAGKTEHIGHGTVRLKSGKMSSRTGEVISALSFIEEIKTTALERMEATAGTSDEATAHQVAIAAIKYATLRGDITQDTVFDKEQALSFEGDSGPYLQYTYARIQSVLAKANEAGVAAKTDSTPEQSYALEHLLYRWPEVTKEALMERSPHVVTRYLTDLAGAFNTFYAEEKIADPADRYAPYKAALSLAVAQTLKNGLWVLGIEAPERM